MVTHSCKTKAGAQTIRNRMNRRGYTTSLYKKKRGYSVSVSKK